VRRRRLPCPRGDRHWRHAGDGAGVAQPVRAGARFTGVALVGERRVGDPARRPLMRTDDRTARVYWFLLAAPLFLLVVFYLYPLAKVLWLSVTVPTPGLGNFAKLVTSDAIHKIIGTTARLSAITTIVSLFLGYIVAYAVLHVRTR